MTQPRHDNRYSDAANRMSDAIRIHILAGKSGRWVAFRLSDGSSDGVAYERRSDAVRHQLHETQCAYIKVPHDDCPPAHAERLLALHRTVYDSGLRFTDPDDPREIIMPYTREDIARLNIRRVTGGR